MQAIEWLHADRIGHGYFLVQDEELYNKVKKDRIHLEVVISNDDIFQYDFMNTNSCNFIRRVTAMPNLKSHYWSCSKF